MKTEKRYNIIYKADSRKLIDQIGNSIKVKSTITSPPYFDMKDYGSKNQIGFGQTYQEYLNDLKDIFSQIYEITENDGSLWIVIDTFKRENQVVTLPFDLANKLKEIGWFLQDIIIWKKDKTVPWSNNGFVQRKFEYILFFSKSITFKYNKDRVRNFDTDQLKKWWIKYPERYNPKGKALDEIWEFPIPVQGSWGDKYIRHFCPLPKEMVATMIEISTDKNDVILDPFAGSGSVLFQSAVMNRKYIGFELNQDYIDMFENYLKMNLRKSTNEYKQLSQLEGQDEFKKRIWNLRALKYGRLLVNELDKRFNYNFKVFVKIIGLNIDKKTQLVVEYQLIGNPPLINDVLQEVTTIIKTSPFSKFGIKSIFKTVELKKLDKNKYYVYTKTNSYSFSDLPIDSTKAKVISEICVNFNENDYN